MELETREELSDVLEWIKISGAAWYGNGFFYSRYPEPEAGMRLSEAHEYHTVHYHRSGADQWAAGLIFRADNAPKRYHTVGPAAGGNDLLLRKASGTDGV